MSEKDSASVAVVGAGDLIGAAIARRFAAEGFTVNLGCRSSDKLRQLIDEIVTDGGRAQGRALDERRPADVTTFLAETEALAPMALTIFNINGNVSFPVLDTTERVFGTLWEMACLGGFITGREAARIMLPRGKGKIFFTGATASLRGGQGHVALAAAKAGLRMVAQSMARELRPKNIHVAHLIIDAGVDIDFAQELIAANEGDGARGDFDPDRLMPAAISDAFWQLFRQEPATWEFEQEIQPNDGRSGTKLRLDEIG